MKKFKDLCTTAKTKMSKVGYSAMAAAGTLSLMTPMVAADQLTENIKTAIGTVKTLVLTIFLPLALVAFIIAAIFRMVSKNPRTAEEATEWMKRILITAAIAGGATLLLNWAVTLTGSGSGLGTLS